MMIQDLIFPFLHTPQHKQIAEKIIHQQRLTQDDALFLYQNASLDFLGILANWVKEKRFGKNVFYNRNFHIEPTNVCVFACKFCSYSRSYKNKEEGWEMSIEQMMHIVKKYDNQPVTEVHIVGGVHPKMNLDFFIDLIKQIKIHRPQLHIKAFTAVELEYMFRKAKVSTQEGFLKLKDAGLNSIPGGGAEIFHPDIRTKICDDKATAQQWLDIHKTAHLLNIPSNATMLYGHIETYEHRIHHLNLLRDLQDEAPGFNTFIPLKFRNQNNEMSHITEVNLLEDLKNYAVARLFLDNIDHIKAYWPMLGRHNAQLSLSFGVDDLDGTIDDTTKIYSMAGSEEDTPAMTTEDIQHLVANTNRVAVERDTLYNIIA